jgi:hypothetical protein
MFGFGHKRQPRKLTVRLVVTPEEFGRTFRDLLRGGDRL